MVTDTAPATKIEAIEQLGATIVRASYDECWRTVEAHASDRMRGLFIHPFDDDRFIAGNGTAGLEILDDVPDVDVVIAPLGGGGLLAGIASAIHARRPEVKVYAAEPETASPFDTSLGTGARARFERWQASFVDGAGGRSVLPTMWPLLSRLLAGSIVVALRRRGGGHESSWPNDATSLRKAQRAVRSRPPCQDGSRGISSPSYPAGTSTWRRLRH